MPSPVTRTAPTAISPLWTLFARRVAPAREAAAVSDTLSLGSPLRNARFAGDAALARIARGGEVLGKADRGAVFKVQEALLAMAFFMPGGADGALGPGTAQAIRNFQAAAGLPRTGKVDAATLRELDRHAPAPGKTAWDPGSPQGLVPDPVVRDAQGKPYMERGRDGVMRPMTARVVVAIGQHRVFHFDRDGELKQIYAARTGKEQDRGSVTVPAVKRVDTVLAGKELSDLGARLWDAPGAFGESLVALTAIDPATRQPTRFRHNGQELHGVPNNGRGEPAGLGFDFSHGCVGIANEHIKAISADVRAGEIINFIP